MAKQDLTAQHLRELLHYDPDTGVFTRRVATGYRGRHRAGGICGGPDTISGYVKIRVDGKPYYAHRLAWLYVYGEWPIDEIDHADGNRQNNRISNLRQCTGGENKQNLQRARSNSKSGILGVSWSARDKVWVAHVSLGGKVVHSSNHQTAEAARAAYWEAKLRHHVLSPSGPQTSQK